MFLSRPKFEAQAVMLELADALRTVRIVRSYSDVAASPPGLMSFLTAIHLYILKRTFYSSVRHTLTPQHNFKSFLSFHLCKVPWSAIMWMPVPFLLLAFCVIIISDYHLYYFVASVYTLVLYCLNHNKDL